MKPMLFNTGMVRAIREDRKTVTRRLVKPQPPNAHMIIDYDEENNSFDFLCDMITDGRHIDFAHTAKAPCRPGDILYVRETWYYETFYENTDNSPDLPSGKRSWRYVYKADNPDYPVIPGHWRPSIHMPREAARIFLRVTDVQVERLWNITNTGLVNDFGLTIEEIVVHGWRTMGRKVWDSTVKKADRALYGWEANPWVWVIAFERIRG